MILPALTEATSPFWRPIKYSLFPPLGLATLAGYLDDDEVEIQDEHVETLDLDDSPDLVVIQVYITSAYRAYRLADHYRARGVYVALGGLHARSRQPGEAAEQFEFLLDRSADDQEALLGLASCRIEQGWPKDALALLEKLRADPVPPRALFLRGKAALEQLDPAAAERWLSQAALREPNDPETLHQLVLALRSQGKQAEADRLALRLEALHKDLARLVDVTRTIRGDPKNVEAWHEAGVLALRLGRTDEGLRCLEGALRVRPDHRPTHAALAEHFRRQGDPRADRHQRLAQTP